MAWTKADLDKLENAINQGGAVLRVKYSDKEVTYRSLDEMLRLRDVMRAELGCAVSRPVFKKTSFSKDLE